MNLLLRHAGPLLGTGFGTGYSPIAPGTAGSLAALAIYLLLPVPGDSLWFYGLIVLSFGVGVWATGSLVTEEAPDPGRAVWDEFVGLWITCLLLPKTWPWMVSAFLLFRLLDILKPWPARRLENLHGGLGIMADDVMAGIYGALILNCAKLIISSL